MKKKYQAPNTKTVTLFYSQMLMASFETKRFTSGAPTTDDDFPTNIGSSSMSDVQSMFGKGQADGMNRSREFWDD